MAQSEGVYVFPDAMAKASGIDPGLLALMNNGGGFGGNNAWWLIFLWMMWASNGNNGWNGNGANGTGFLSNQINNDRGNDLVLQAINGRADALGQLAQITNSSVEAVKNNLFTIQSSIQSLGSQVGMSGLQVQNAISSGNAALAQQLCQCCCENRLAICNQTNALQSQAASNFAASTLEAAKNQAATQLQMAQIESADQLAVCRQTNELSTQAANNTNVILGAIKDQNAMIVDQFCALKERELQNKIDTQGDIITQLRGQISNDKQTEAFNAAFNSLNDKINSISAKQPQTVPVIWPNLTAINSTPNVGFNPWGYGTSYWG